MTNDDYSIHTQVVGSRHQSVLRTPCYIILFYDLGSLFENRLNIFSKLGHNSMVTSPDILHWQSIIHVYIKIISLIRYT